PFDVDNPRHLVSLGPFKRHVTEAAKVLTLMDLGVTFFFFIFFLLAPCAPLFIIFLTFFVPCVLTLLAVKNGNKHYALAPFIVSVLFFGYWTISCIYALFAVQDIYKIVKQMVVDVPIAEGINSPFLRTMCYGIIFAVVEAAIYLNMKTHYILYRFLKEQEAARKSATLPTHTAAPAAYQGSYQGYDAQPQFVQNTVY
ncbi:hypothetical protein PMAYCL1PPCAC_04832, partial [Pristionchus mayeri]